MISPPGISETVEHLVEFEKRDLETEETNDVMIVFTVGICVTFMNYKCKNLQIHCGLAPSQPTTFWHLVYIDNMLINYLIKINKKNSKLDF